MNTWIVIRNDNSLRISVVISRIAMKVVKAIVRTWGLSGKHLTMSTCQNLSFMTSRSRKERLTSFDTEIWTQNEWLTNNEHSRNNGEHDSNPILNSDLLGHSLDELLKENKKRELDGKCCSPYEGEKGIDDFQ